METKLTTKQMSVKIDKILKGVDNSVAQIQKHQSAIGEAIPVLRSLAGGIANSVETAKTQTLVKAVKPAKAPKPAKPAKAPKPAKPAKAPKPAKPAKAPKPAKTPKPAKPAKAPKPAKPNAKPSSVRPALKQVINDVLVNNGTPMSSADIYNTIINKHGKWSRQSVYNALKDVSMFTKNEGVFSLGSKVKKSDEKIEALVANVAADSDVAKVV
jgi:outer membrane biosynthesis protein TonB